MEGAVNEKDGSPNVMVFVRGLQRDRLFEEDRRVLAGEEIDILVQEDMKGQLSQQHVKPCTLHYRLYVRGWEASEKNVKEV